ncbi:hypothetical protein [Streptomyces roseochromogenus]|uniref:Uncharacterized protein n=1 Tax=Streptomyces roseochromogenus subsp. oscitans DS 12.976 TaxID=1352936 RepID=V6JXQ7_STRRC|nr:hypothetical protein [Streptomyces roseochromogenus]EST24488.1 hypothetical protein M878_30445 [Streptomyces roseochromogenus subsp. oscitans DS 12.976]
MSVLTIQPGESVDDFISRIANTAPEPSSRLLDRVRTLLAIEEPAVTPLCAAPSQITRAAA